MKFVLTIKFDDGGVYTFTGTAQEIAIRAYCYGTCESQDGAKAIDIKVNLVEEM